jgi:hypothetical protein
MIGETMTAGKVKSIEKNQKASEPSSPIRAFAREPGPDVSQTAFDAAMVSQMAGNLAVQQLFRARVIQHKLAVSAPDDPYEREADGVADEVMRMPERQSSNQELSFSSVRASTAQRKCIACEEEEEKLQRKESASAVNAPATAPNIVNETLNAPGQPLDSATQAFFEPRFEHDLSGVRVFADARANESAAALHARAFTVGQNIVFGAAEYAPGTAQGKELLAHELTHTIQQRAQDGSTPDIQRQPKGDAPPTLDVPSGTPEAEAQASYDFNIERLTEKEFQKITGLPSTMLAEGNFTDARHLNISGLPAGTAPPGLVVGDQPAWLSQEEGEDTTASELDVALAAAGLGLIRVPYIGPRPYTPQQLFDILATDRAWSFNRGGPPVMDPARTGAAAGGRYAGRTVFCGIQIADRFGNRVDVALGQHLVSQGLVHTPAHAEPQAMRALERSIPRLPDLRGGQMTVVVDQLPCPPSSQNCAGALRAFANRHGLGLEVIVPERPDVRPWRQGASVAPRTATMSSMRPNLPILETGQNYRLVPLEDMRVAPAKPVTARPARPWVIAGESPAARRGATAFIRYGGTILTVYSAYGSVERLYDAWNQGSDEFVTALVHETGTWTGGAVGAAVGGQVARYTCVFTGPFALACTVVMSLGGGWLGAKIGNWLAGVIMTIINLPEIIAEAFTTIIEVMGDISHVVGAVAGAPFQLLIENLARSYKSLDPANWDVRYLPPTLVNDVKELGRAIWTPIASAKNLDDVLSGLPHTLADVDVAPDLLKRVAGTLTALEQQSGSGIVYTPSGLLAMTPLEVIKILETHRLRYVVDPEYFAGIERPEDTEGYRRVHLAPLIRDRASLNAANWKLDHLPEITENDCLLRPKDDLLEFASLLWKQLGDLDQKGFAEAISRPLSALSLPPLLLENIAFEIQSIIRFQGVGSLLGLEYILPPETLLKMNPIPFVDFLVERDILRFRQAPGYVAEVALHWVKMGYQPW